MTVVFGPEHRETAIARYNRAYAYEQCETYDMAERNHRQNLALLEAHPKTERELLWETRFDLASYLLRRKKLKESRRIMETVLAEVKAARKRNNPDRLYYEACYASLLVASKDLVNAAQLFLDLESRYRENGSAYAEEMSFRLEMLLRENHDLEDYLASSDLQGELAKK